MHIGTFIILNNNWGELERAPH